MNFTVIAKKKFNIIQREENLIIIKAGNSHELKLLLLCTDNKPVDFMHDNDSFAKLIL